MIQKLTEYDSHLCLAALTAAEEQRWLNWWTDDEYVVEVTSYRRPGAAPPWAPRSRGSNPVKMAAALGNTLCFQAAPFNGCTYAPVAPHTRNNWLCYDFKQRMIVPMHYAIRRNSNTPGSCHLKSW
jgi:hypothetical protein